MSSDSESAGVKRILHVVTRPMEAPVEQLIRDQGLLPAHQVVIHRLDEGEPDYRLLLKEVFAADSIQCW